MATADLYIRVSTDEQAIRGYSQNSQEDRLNAYCRAFGIEIRQTIFEDYSAKNFKRPAWSALVQRWRKSPTKRPDLLLFTRWDRFSRNITDAFVMIGKLRAWKIEPQAIDQPLDLSVPENLMILAMAFFGPNIYTLSWILVIPMNMYFNGKKRKKIEAMA